MLPRKRTKRDSVKKDNRNIFITLGVIGLLVTVWLAVLIAPTIGGGLPVMLPKLKEAFLNPFRFAWCDNTLP